MWKSAAEIAEATRKIAHELNEKFGKVEGERVVVVGVLAGAFMFLADLCRHLKFNFFVDFIRTKSYVEDNPGEFSVISQPKMDLKGATIILVDDILDTGASMEGLKGLIEKMGAKSVHYVCLVANQKSPRASLFTPITFGFPYTGQYIIGYGMDSKELYRHLSDIWFIE